MAAETERAAGPRPLVIVDSANVVGSVPDGWWRDRAGATRALRDALEAVARDGLPAGRGVPRVPGPVDVVLVVEGAARGVTGGPSVRVVPAPGSGDDAITELVRDSADRTPVVVTADRGLRDRVTALGAVVRGPGSVPRRRS